MVRCPKKYVVKGRFFDVKEVVCVRNKKSPFQKGACKTTGIRLMRNTISIGKIVELHVFVFHHG